MQILHGYLQKSCYYMVFPASNAGNSHSIPVKSNSPQIVQLKSEWVLKVTGIAGIHTIHINLKSLHSDFPVESL